MVPIAVIVGMCLLTPLSAKKHDKASAGTPGPKIILRTVRSYFPAYRIESDDDYSRLILFIRKIDDVVHDWRESFAVAKIIYLHVCDQWDQYSRDVGRDIIDDKGRLVDIGGVLADAKYNSYRNFGREHTLLSFRNEYGVRIGSVIDSADLSDLITIKRLKPLTPRPEQSAGWPAGVPEPDAGRGEHLDLGR